jgi:S-adenosylmethionine-dependent methyltransferase
MSNVENHYDSSPEREWDRLGKKNPIEFAITMLALQEYLLAPPANILDIGGGPGRYAVALTQQGYSVTLLDLSRGNLEFARAKADEAAVQLTGYVHGNALSLSQFADESYDTVLLLGPLYHLLKAEERERAIKEAKRVLKIGGYLFSAFLTRSSYIRFMAKEHPSLILDDRRKLIMETGLYKPASEGGFIDAYFAHHHEVKPLMEQCGLQTIDLISCEGLISMIDDKLNELSGAAWEAWVRLNYVWAKDPAVHGMAEHLLYVGRKR